MADKAVLAKAVFWDLPVLSLSETEDTRGRKLTAGKNAFVRWLPD